MFIACYIRKSVVEDDATASPARQRAAIERVVPAKYERRWYQDLDISGRHEAGRPDFMRLLTDLSDPECAAKSAWVNPLASRAAFRRCEVISLSAFT